MEMRFNPAPGWPRPPTGWVPPAGWRPDPTWPPAPPGWQFWVSGAEVGSNGGVPGAVGPRPAHPDSPQTDPGLAPVWAAEITRLAERRRSTTLSRVTLNAPPIKGGLLGRILTIGVGAALGDGINDAAMDAADESHEALGAVRLPSTCLLCGLLPGAESASADITIDASTLGYFLGGELLSQQKFSLPYNLCRECAHKKVRPLNALAIDNYRKVGQAWQVSLLFLNDRVAASVRALNRPNLITALACLQCGFTDDDQAWLAREDVCPTCHTVYAGGLAWLCPQCGKNLPIALLAQPRTPKTWRQAMWGGLTCPRCGADVPKP